MDTYRVLKVVSRSPIPYVRHLTTSRLSSPLTSPFPVRGTPSLLRFRCHGRFTLRLVTKVRCTFRPSGLLPPVHTRPPVVFTVLRVSVLSVPPLSFPSRPVSGLDQLHVPALPPPPVPAHRPAQPVTERPGLPVNDEESVPVMEDPVTSPVVSVNMGDLSSLFGPNRGGGSVCRNESDPRKDSGRDPGADGH